MIITPVDPLTISVNVLQMAIAAVSQTTKGTLFFGAVLNPTLKTSHKMKIMTRGLMKVQKKPSIEPTCWVAMSRFAISTIKNLRRNSVSTKSIKPLNSAVIVCFIQNLFSKRILKKS